VKAPVRSLATQVRGVAYTKGDARSEPAEGFVPLVRAGNITDRGLTFDDLVYVPESCVSARQILQPGDVVVAASSGSIDVVGKAASVLEPSSCAFGAFCKVLRPNDLVDHRYFGHYFRTAGYRRQVSALAAGANINNLRAGDFDGLEIRLPPLDEQQRIAAILDQADELRAKRRAAIAHLDSLTEAIFLDMFGDPESSRWGWPMHPVRSFVNGFDAGRSLVADDADLSYDGYRVLKVSAVTAQEYRPEKSKRVPDGYSPPASHVVRPGDLLFSRANTSELVGASAYVWATPQRMLLSDKLWRFRWVAPSPVEPLFVNSLFHTAFVRREIARRATGTSGSMKNISQSKVGDIVVPIPPKDLQVEFAAQVRLARREFEATQSGSAHLDKLFASLQARAFAGEL